MDLIVYTLLGENNEPTNIGISFNCPDITTQRKAYLSLQDTLLTNVVLNEITECLNALEGYDYTVEDFKTIRHTYIYPYLKFDFISHEGDEFTITFNNGIFVKHFGTI